MDPVMIWTGTTAVAITLGLHGAYYGAIADTCLKIGMGLEGASEGKTGFQDAITPPASTNARLLNWSATLLIAGGAWYFLGGIGISAFLIIRLLATLVGGAILKSDPPKKHFCNIVHRSLSNREADYHKAGDLMRAEAINKLRTKLERSHFGSKLGQ